LAFQLRQSAFVMQQSNDILDFPMPYFISDHHAAPIHTAVILRRAKYADLSTSVPQQCGEVLLDLQSNSVQSDVFDLLSA